MASLFDDYALITKSGLFDVDYYIASNPDVAALDCDPLMHYLEQGARELRNPNETFDAKAYALKCRERGVEPENPLLHFIAGDATGNKDKALPGIAPAAGAAIAGARARAAAVATSDVQLGLDIASVYGPPENTTRRVTGAGWVIAEHPITEVHVTIGQTRATAQYGLRREDVALTFPDRPRAEQSGFTFTVPGLPTDETLGLVDIAFSVKTLDGEQFQKSILTYLLPSMEAVQPEDDPESDPTYRGLPPMKMEVDTSSVGNDGLLRIRGWAVCFAPVASVEVFIDEETIGIADYGYPRSDVALIFGDYPAADISGFELTCDTGTLEGGARTLKVRATASTGIFREVFLPLILAPPRTRLPQASDETINVFCDKAELTTDGILTIDGWAICPDETDYVKVALDGKQIGVAEIGIDRQDVGSLYPAMPHAKRAGFSFRKAIPGRLTEGEHMVVLRVGGGGAEVEVPLPILARASTQQIAGDGAQSTAAEQMRLNVDLPTLVGGAMANPVRGNLEVAGWALARDGVESIDIALDGDFIASAFTGIRRLDVQSHFADWPGSLTSGFTALLPHRALPAGSHRITVTLTDRLGKSLKNVFSVEIEKAPETVGPWSLRRRMTIAETELDEGVLSNLNWHPDFLIYLSVPLNEKDAIAKARKTLASLQAQAYSRWRVLIAPQGKGVKLDAVKSELLDELPALTDRLGLVSDSKSAPQDLIDATQGTPTYIMALAAGDELGCDALMELAIDTGFHCGADFIYTDDRRPNPASRELEAFFKPDWSPDLLLSTNYIGRAWCAAASLIARAALTSAEISRNASYDLVLRLTEAASEVRHLPAVLLQTSELTPGNKIERRALVEALERRGVDGEIKDGVMPGIFRLQRPVKTDGLVSIIIPTCAARGLIKTCIETLRSLTAYQNFEIICIENIPAGELEWKNWLRANADKVIETSEPFNWSRFNNLAVAEAHGDFLLFLNDDIEILTADWLDVLLEQAQRPEVGAVGPQLLYPDRRVQHAGMFLAGTGIARHAFRYMAEDDPGYFGLAKTQRNVISVTGACLLTRRETFERLGRFNETHSIVNNDLDYCLRVWQAGMRTIYTPHTALIHHEQASRVEIDDIYDVGTFSDQWGGLFASGDPFFNPRLSKERDDYSCEWEPVETTFAGRPVFAKETIKKILILKLDHIGDCVIALPAIRRLKQHFPDAQFYVLSSKASKPVWALEDAIDEVIEFDFFNARSSLGTVALTENDWRALEATLAPYGFDLAIDFRKHMETRPVLQRTGARYLAGYDHHGKYPWLDVALEWSQDQASFRKRQHTSTDLINLANAIATAGEQDRGLIAPRPAAPIDPKLKKSGLYKKPVVCVHPTAGNDTKQWPPEYFTALIDQLIKQDDVHIAVIGSPDDTEIAAAIVAAVDRKDAVWSLVGKLTLSELPAFIGGCSLFIGNDSGPKHIAAGMGVPTVGIHSGVIDAREWGPMGPSAVAIDRDMTCSPCYRSKLEDCHRGLACLRQIFPGDVYRVSKRMLALRETGPVGGAT